MTQHTLIHSRVLGCLLVIAAFGFRAEAQPSARKQPSSSDQLAGLLVNLKNSSNKATNSRISAEVVPNSAGYACSKSESQFEEVVVCAATASQLSRSNQIPKFVLHTPIASGPAWIALTLPNTSMADLQRALGSGWKSVAPTPIGAEGPPPSKCSASYAWTNIAKTSSLLAQVFPGKSDDCSSVQEVSITLLTPTVKGK